MSVVLVKSKKVRLVRDLTQQNRLFELSEMIMFEQTGEQFSFCFRVKTAKE